MRPIAYLLILLLIGCDGRSDLHTAFSTAPIASISMDVAEDHSIIHPKGSKLISRFHPPEGARRTDEEEGSFAEFLRQLPLKPHGSEVLLYGGGSKWNQEAHAAVVDLPIGKKDLHQCADAIMRLRAEYLWQQKQYDRIHFNLTNGFRVDYSEWMKGKRIIVKGNSTSWSAPGPPSNTHADLWNYLETIFTYAGSLSLSKELRSVPFEDLQIGDVFIFGGTPGHAIIVIDMAIDEKNGSKYFMLAQSFMPAQETHVLKNPGDSVISPWYSENIGDELITPEWTFRKDQLMRFQE